MLLALLLTVASPYPPPRLVTDDADLKFASGVVVAIDRDSVVVQTDAGPVQLRLDGALVLNASDDREGASVEVWYTVNEKVGAFVKELDLGLLVSARAAQEKRLRPGQIFLRGDHGRRSPVGVQGGQRGQGRRGRDLRARCGRRKNSPR